MREYSRQEPIILTLPHDYRGKTLTIAHSTPPCTETGEILATPTTVILYCVYAYESGLISETYTRAIAAAALFAVAVILLIGGIRRRDGGMLCLAVMEFFGMCSILCDASFGPKYYTSPVDLYTWLRWGSALTMLVFLAMKAGSRKKPVQILTAAVFLVTTVSMVISAVYPETVSPGLNFLKYDLMEYLFLLTLAGILVCGILFWRKEKRFYKLFTQLTLICLGSTGYCFRLLPFLRRRFSFTAYPFFTISLIAHSHP